MVGHLQVAFGHLRELELGSQGDHLAGARLGALSAEDAPPDVHGLIESLLPDLRDRDSPRRAVSDAKLAPVAEVGFKPGETPELVGHMERHIRIADRRGLAEEGPDHRLQHGAQAMVFFFHTTSSFTTRSTMTCRNATGAT